MDTEQPEPSFAEKLIELDKAIAHEEQLWNVEQISPQMLNIDVYLLNIKMRMMTSLLTQKFGMTEDEVNVYFKTAVFEQLNSDRQMIRDAKRSAIAVPPPLPFGGLLGPNGNPLAN